MECLLSLPGVVRGEFLAHQMASRPTCMYACFLDPVSRLTPQVEPRLGLLVFLLAGSSLGERDALAN